MLDIRLIRENPEMIRKNLVRRHDPDKEKLLEDVIRWDRAWRKALAEADGLKRRRNEITKEIAAAKKAGKSTDKLRKEAAALPKKIEALDGEIDDLAAKVRDGLMRLPNLLDESVPVGDDEPVRLRRRRGPRRLRERHVQGPRRGPVPDRDVGASHRRDVHGRGDRRPPAAPPLRGPGDPVPPGDRGPRRRHEGPLP